MPILALFMLHTQRGSAQQVLFSINQHTSLNTDLTPLRNQISDQKKKANVVASITTCLLCCMKFKCVQLSITLKVSQQLFRQ